MTGLDTATALDFLGPSTIDSASGDFAGLAGATGTVSDLTFNNSATVRQAAFSGLAAAGSLSLLNFQNFSFDLQSVSVTLQLANVLVLTGTGIFSMPGYDDTFGTFTFIANGLNSTFTFTSVPTPASIPEPASLTLVAFGMLLAGAFLRRRLA